MPMKFLPDTPIMSRVGDTLGLTPVAEKLKMAIEYTEAPFVFGVLGDWGSGKTSILNILKHELEEDLRDTESVIVPIWFNAWEYENESNILYPLLYQIKRDYQRRVPVTAGRTNFIDCFLKVVASSTLTLVDFGLRAVTQRYLANSISLQDVADTFSKLQEKSKKLEEALDSWASEVEMLKNSYRELMTIYAEDIASARHQPVSAVRFVIIIDDLDRCLPETVIHLLEGIKNYLSAPYCIYVFGLNPRVIYQGIQVKYNSLAVNGREYLEKIINYGFYIPEPDLSKLRMFTDDSLDKLIAPAERNNFKRPFAIFADVLTSCHFTNPRKIKRVLNHYLYFLDKYTSEINSSYYDLSNTVRFILMAEYFPDLFERFIRDPAAASSSLAKLANSKTPVSEIETELGLPLLAIYPQLVKMQNLFRLTARSGGMADLPSQAAAVYQIVRLPG